MILKVMWINGSSVIALVWCKNVEKLHRSVVGEWRSVEGAPTWHTHKPVDNGMGIHGYAKFKTILIPIDMYTCDHIILYLCHSLSTTLLCLAFQCEGGLLTAPNPSLATINPKSKHNCLVLESPVS